MRDIFYTLLVVWVLYRIWNSFFARPVQRPTSQQQEQRRQGDIRVENMNPSSPKKNNDDGEYVDYTEVKD